MCVVRGPEVHVRARGREGRGSGERGCMQGQWEGRRMEMSHRGLSCLRRQGERGRRVVGEEV